jgi:hypothetical protein
MTENHTELCEYLELYVLQGLSDEETKQFEEHLAQCEACKVEVKEMADIVGLLPLASDQVDVPEGMKDRVLQHVLGNKPSESDSHTKATKLVYQKASLASRLAMSGLSAAAVLLLVTSIFLYVDNRNLEQEVAEKQDMTQRLELALKELKGPVQEPIQPTSIVSLNPAAEEFVSKGLASIVIDERGTHLLVMAESLPKLQGSEAFQVWLLQDGKPSNAGTFLAHQGTGAFYYTIESEKFDTVVITVEPDAHGQQPRGYALLSAEL